MSTLYNVDKVLYLYWFTYFFIFICLRQPGKLNKLISKIVRGFWKQNCTAYTKDLKIFAFYEKYPPTMHNIKFYILYICYKTFNIVYTWFGHMQTHLSIFPIYISLFLFLLCTCIIFGKILLMGWSKYEQVRKSACILYHSSYLQAWIKAFFRLNCKFHPSTYLQIIDVDYA